MAGNLIIKNGQDQEFKITHNDNVGAVTLESNKIAVKNDTKKRRNYLINGNFQFWDYATSQTTADYGSDNRWNNYNIGSTKIHSRITSGDTERALFESPYYSRTIVNSVAGASNYVQKLQRIEDITKLADKTVTISFWARADSAKNIAISIVQDFGTGGSPSSHVDIPLGLIGLTSTWQKKTITVSIPSIVGKTHGTDGLHTSYTELSIAYDAGTVFNSFWSNLGQQSGTFDLAEIKLEDGSIATDGWSPYDGEWGSEAIARMRYYEICNSMIRNDYRSDNTAVFGVAYTFKAVKRASPSLTKKSESYNNTSSGAVNSGFYAPEVNANVLAAGSITTGGTISQEYKVLFTASAEL